MHFESKFKKQTIFAAKISSQIWRKKLTGDESQFGFHFSVCLFVVTGSDWTLWLREKEVVAEADAMPTKHNLYK